MENTKLNFAISSYCKKNNLQKTFKALNLTAKTGDLCVADIFEKYYANAQGEGLSFTFNLKNERSQLRKRLLDPSVQTVVNKKEKVGRVKDKKNDEVPGSFFQLLDELGLDRKKAKLLYENKDQWAFVISDRLIYCTEPGTLLFYAKVNCF